MKKYILKAEGNGKMPLFVFSVLLVGLTMIAAFSGISGGMFLDAFASLPTEQANDVGAVIAGFLFVPVMFYWGFACLFCWLVSFVINKKLDKGQKKRFSAIYFIAFVTISSIATPFVMIYIDNISFFAANTILYFGGLKIADTLFVKKI